MKVIALCGSRRDPSSTRRGLAVALEAAEAAGAEIGWLELRELDLPFCDGRSEGYGPEVDAFRAAVASADALIIGSPEYHGSMTGALKNALDLLGPEELRDKMVGLVATARGDAGAMNTLNHLRHVARWMNAWVLPTQVSIPQAHTRLGEDADPEIRDRLEKLGQEVVRYGGLLRGS
jgi:FMN reductase